MITVKDIRSAIEGLPDSAIVGIAHAFSDDVDPAGFEMTLLGIDAGNPVLLDVWISRIPGVGVRDEDALIDEMLDAEELESGDDETP